MSKNQIDLKKFKNKYSNLTINILSPIDFLEQNSAEIEYQDVFNGKILPLSGYYEKLLENQIYISFNKDSKLLTDLNSVKKEFFIEYFKFFKSWSSDCVLKLDGNNEIFLLKCKINTEEELEDDTEEEIEQKNKISYFLHYLNSHPNVADCIVYLRYDLIKNDIFEI